MPNYQRYQACLESMQPFWTSWEMVVWPWCNLAACQRRPYCASVNSHSPVGLVSRQWDATDWACVLCDHRIHNDQASRSANLHQCACPFYSSRASIFGKTLNYPGLSASLRPRFGSLRLLGFSPKLKSPLKVRRFLNAMVTLYKSIVNSISLPND